MYLGQLLQRPTILAPAAGDRAYSPLANGLRTFWIDLIVRARVTVGAGATTIYNGGSVLALFDQIGLEENSADVQAGDPRLLRFISELHAPSSLPAARLTATAAAAYDLEETVRLFFAHPLAIAPSETAFIERDISALLQVFVKYNGTVGKIVDGANNALSNVSVEVFQQADSKRGDLPLFRSTYREISLPVLGTVAGTPIPIKTEKAIRLVAFQTDSNKGAQKDIITKLKLGGDTRDVIGPKAATWDSLVQLLANAFGGAIGDTTGGAYYAVNFQEGGRVNNVLTPDQPAAVNLRAEIDAGLSASAGVTSCSVRVGILELERVPGLTAPDSAFQERGVTL